MRWKKYSGCHDRSFANSSSARGRSDGEEADERPELQQPAASGMAPVRAMANAQAFPKLLPSAQWTGSGRGVKFGSGGCACDAGPATPSLPANSGTGPTQTAPAKMACAGSDACRQCALEFEITDSFDDPEPAEPSPELPWIRLSRWLSPRLRSGRCWPISLPSTIG